VLKVLNDPHDRCQKRDEWCYWKRELLAFESGMLANLPEAVRVPHCYGVTEHQDSGWIWMEEIVPSTDPHWSMEHYHLAARQAGRVAGSFLGSLPLPDQPWLSASFYRSALDDGTRWAAFMDETSSVNAWQSPIVQQAFSDSLRSRVKRIWREKQRIFDTFDRLPQVLCHYDFHRRNLMIRENTDGLQELIALDWAFCGLGPIGADIAELVGGSTYYFEVEPAQLPDFEETVLDGYLAGLHDSGWDGDMSLARLGYLSAIALWSGATLPGWVGGILDIDLEKTCGRPAQEVIAGWVLLCEYLMERADEARHLVRALGLA
jgi:hypothetical protein